MPPQKTDWSRVKLVIFDVDGTLYFQRKLQVRMLLLLFQHYLFHPIRVRDLCVIYNFRKMREGLADEPKHLLETEQYRKVAYKLNISVDQVRRVIEKWMLLEPLRVLPECNIPNAREFVEELRSQGTKVAFLSDYPAIEKLNSLKIIGDLVISSVDKEINALKPSPKGILHILGKLDAQKESSVMIGDRDEKDGEAARRAGVKFIILPRSKNNFYTNLLKLIKPAGK